MLCDTWAPPTTHTIKWHKPSLICIHLQSINSVKKLRGRNVDGGKSKDEEVGQIPTFTSTLTKQIFLKQEAEECEHPSTQDSLQIQGDEEGKLGEAAGFTNPRQQQSSV